MSVDTSAWFSQPTILMHAAIEDFKEIASEYDCKTHFYKDYSIDAGIRHFVEEHGIDLIGISNQSKNKIKRFFQGSNVEMLVNHCDAAVLSMEI